MTFGIHHICWWNLRTSISSSAALQAPLVEWILYDISLSIMSDILAKWTDMKYSVPSSLSRTPAMFVLQEGLMMRVHHIYMVGSSSVYRTPKNYTNGTQQWGFTKALLKPLMRVDDGWWRFITPTQDQWCGRCQWGISVACGRITVPWLSSKMWGYPNLVKVYSLSNYYHNVLHSQLSYL